MRRLTAEHDQAARLRQGFLLKASVPEVFGLGPRPVRQGALHRRDQPRCHFRGRPQTAERDPLRLVLAIRLSAAFVAAWAELLAVRRRGIARNSGP